MDTHERTRTETPLLTQADRFRRRLLSHLSIPALCSLNQPQAAGHRIEPIGPPLHQLGPDRHHVVAVVNGRDLVGIAMSQLCFDDLPAERPVKRRMPPKGMVAVSIEDRRGHGTEPMSHMPVMPANALR